MGRNYLAGRAGDAANAVLAAVGYNFSLLLVWLAGLGWLLRMLVRSAGTAAPNARYAT
jgi:IS5 family transposase